MRLRIGRPRQAFIVAPHPDDEIIGAAGLIQALQYRGTRIAVIVVSNGAASHPNSRLWPERRLTAERRRESRRALRRIGVPAGNIAFLNLPDGALPANMTRCRQGLRRALGVPARIDLVVGPAATDAHPDHRTVAAALRPVTGAARRLAYQVWPARPSSRASTRSVVIAGGCPVKRSLIALHRTQLGAIRDDPSGFAVARHELATFSHPVERFMEMRR